jgi:hypothetical protein
MREVRLPQQDLFNAAVQWTRVCQLTAHPTGHLSNNVAALKVCNLAIFAIVTGTVLALGACTEAPTAVDGNPAGGRPSTRPPSGMRLVSVAVTARQTSRSTIRGARPTPPN